MTEESTVHSNISSLGDDNTAVKNAKTNTRSETVIVDKVYACELCSATFNRHANYTRHKKIHSVHPKVF